MILVCELDGNALCIREPKFRNIQESPCMFVELTEDQMSSYLLLKQAVTAQEGIEQTIKEVKEEIDRMPDKPNVGKKGCVAKLQIVLEKIQRC